MSGNTLSTAARLNLESLAAGIEGVLGMLDQLCDTSEGCFSALCLLRLLRAQLEGILAEELAT
ncbi:DUF1484 family protein [Cupriavidus sp. P-10]|uniref:hypothetical protein n=1 Tax=Cupriavidus sp. P-10 TaxID=2027911 RepID=UPI000E2EFE02|nr:hypothetical protein [Cupriavidus sp. P-10]BDB25677.1 DUF1484 family protein [Cupriavidus sp. P-10]